MDFIAQFQIAMQNAGLTCLDEIVADGNLYRYRVDADSAGSKNGWYVLYSDYPSAGTFGSWKTGSKHTWYANKDAELTDEQKILLQQRIKTVDEKRKVARQKAYYEAQKRAQSIWDKALPAVKHSYLVAKQIKSSGARTCKRQDGESLVIPLQDKGGTIHSLQFIASTGQKRFLTDGAVKGNYYIIGDLTNTLYLVEGFATGATIYEATNCGVVCAFNANNLLPVAQVIQNKYPDKQLVVCADNDQWTEGNPGVTKATEAAKSTGIKLVIPDFTGIVTSSKPSDFNDLYLITGIEEVKQQLLKAISINSSEAKKKPYLRLKEDKTSRLPFSDIEPYPEAINPAQLLNELSDTIRSFIVLDIEQAHALTLWVALTWFIDVVEIAPLAIINAPEKACGKTQLLTVLGRLSYRPLSASNASVSVLFRAIELWRPTILIDEADTFFKENQELHGIVNAGYSRDVPILRSEAVGNTFEPRSFSVFSSKVISGINLEKHLPDATMSRGIIINLRRKLPHESVSRLRHSDKNSFEIIASKLARFAIDYSQQIKEARPMLPEVLSDREQDNWDGLFAVALCAGNEWLSYATTAALKLSGTTEKTVSTSNELLSDIQQIFEAKRITRIKTAELIDQLCADEEAPWATYNRGKPISPRQVSSQLAKYGITSKTIRCNSYETSKGFELSQFLDAFNRYLPATLNLPSHPSQTQEPSPMAVSSVTDNPSHITKRNDEVTDKPALGLDCYGVTDKTAVRGDILKSNTSHLRI